MSTAIGIDPTLAAHIPTPLPTHKDLPETDGAVVINFLETPQTTLLNGTMRPRLDQLFPDGQYLVGNDNGIYWRITDPPLRGSKAPDWFLVVGRPPMLDGEFRRSYVLWQELVHPLIVIEYVSGDGTEEHDRTPIDGKFWVYEKEIRTTYYAITDGIRGTLELYRREGEVFRQVPPNAAGRFPVPELGVELGLWHATLMGHTGWYVRPWDIATGGMLPSWEDDRQCLDEERQRADEETQRADDAERRAEDERLRAEDAERRAEKERDRAEEERLRAERLAAKLRELGVDPE